MDFGLHDKTDNKKSTFWIRQENFSKPTDFAIVQLNGKQRCRL